MMICQRINCCGLGGFCQHREKGKAKNEEVGNDLNAVKSCVPLEKVTK